MAFPVTRLRRLRRTERLRGLVRETGFEVGALVQPFFVIDGVDLAVPIGAMPGQFRLSVDRLVECSREVWEVGIGAVLLFGLPSRKDAAASSAHDPDGVIPRAIRSLREALPELPIIADVCCCEYTDHGHCGVIRGGAVDNDATLAVLARAAVVYADAGADVIAPSDMMDGRVAAIRSALDANRHERVAILSYAVKFASAYYGPFREAADCAPRFGDRRGYQLEPANLREAMREAEADITEGADALMVKPALPYLDVVAELRRRYLLPLAAYQVSGEYAQIKAAAERGWIDEASAVHESLLAMRRAGADILVTYFAIEFARRQRELNRSGALWTN